MKMNFGNNISVLGYRKFFTDLRSQTYRTNQYLVKVCFHLLIDIQIVTTHNDHMLEDMYSIILVKGFKRSSDTADSIQT